MTIFHTIKISELIYKWARKYEAMSEKVVLNPKGLRHILGRSSQNDAWLQARRTLVEAKGIPTCLARMKIPQF